MSLPTTPPVPPNQGLRLYVARGTPNSARAERNLAFALERRQHGCTNLEVIDVFVSVKRAIRDGVIVTPTLIAYNGSQRNVMMGDLTDGPKLELLLDILDFGI